MLKTIAVPPMGEQKKTDTLLNFWHVREGDSVEKGDDLVELVTDKAAFNLPSPNAGKVERLLIPEGATVSEGDDLLEIEADL